jgi:hypothetical protein
VTWQIAPASGTPRRLVWAKLTAVADGAWSLQAIVSGADPIEGRVTCTLGENDWIGTVIHSHADGGRRAVEVIGGAGGLSTPVKDLNEHGPATTIDRIAAAICTIGGEQLGEAPTTALGAWQRLRGTVGTALGDLCRATGLRWRVRADGDVVLYQDTAPEQDAPGTLLERGSVGARFGVSTFAFEPPATVDGMLVQTAVGTIDEKGNARLELRAGIGIDQLLEDPPAHTRVFQGRLISQDGKLVDVRIGAPSSGGIGPGGVGPSSGSWTVPRVPLWPGLPGVEMKLRPNAGLLVLFVDADPRKAIAIPAPYGEVAEEVTITTQGGTRIRMTPSAIEIGEGASHPLARGDVTKAWLRAILNGICINGSPLQVTPPPEFPIPFAEEVESPGPGRTP